MKPISKIRKGHRFEKQIAQEIQDAGFGLARREAGSGSGLRKGDIASNLPFLIEAKNQKTIKIQEWVRQAKSQAKIGNYDPDKWALVFKNPESPDANPEMFVTIDFYQFLELMKTAEQPKMKEPDREMKYKIERFVEYGRSLLKEFK